jgi:hypothetical protein
MAAVGAQRAAGLPLIKPWHQPLEWCIVNNHYVLRESGELETGGREGTWCAGIDDGVASSACT